MSAEPILEVRALNKSFGGVKAVNDCTFAVRAGSVVGLIGPNGAGKSTTIDMVSGFGRPDSGSVRFDGQELISQPPHRISRLGLIRTFQAPREWGSLTVLDNVMLGMRAFARESIPRNLFSTRAVRRGEAADRVRVEEILDEFNLGGLRHERAETLSGGQKRLVEFARVAAARPRLVILDEPMGGVNPVLGERMSHAIKDFVTAGSTVVIVEHNMRFIEETCHEVVVMDLGHVIAQGPYSSLRDDERVVAAYLGSVDDDG
ncbi:MAG: ABC transporter ATP-binding protein [Solirubrobacteraceae bacterium]